MQCKLQLPRRLLLVNKLQKEVKVKEMSTSIPSFSSSSQSNNWEEEFDPVQYLTSRYRHPETIRNHFAKFLLRCLHQFSTTKAPVSSSGSGGLRVLEYGCGPVPIHTISFARHASEVVLAEYLEKNRGEVQKWLDGEKQAFDWTSYVEYVVRTLEGSTEEGSVIKREEKMREVIKAVVPCDIRQTPPIGHECAGPYDIILSVFCLEAGARTTEEYQAGVRKLACLLKPGGSLLLFSGKWERNLITGNEKETGFYTIGESTFHNVAVNQELVVHALENSDCSDITVEEMAASMEDGYEGIQTDVVGFLFASGKYC